MYLNHFGLALAPFSTTPDTRFFLELNNAHGLFMEALSTLNAPDGLMLVRGKAGMGKTMLCRKLINALLCHKGRYRLIHISHPRLSKQSFLCAIAHELDIDETPRASLESEVVNALHKNAENGLINAFLVDEAQSMPDEALERLRKFADTKTPMGSLVRVVLFAQPARRKELRQSRSRILADRITSERNMTPLRETDTIAYVNLRLARSGYNGEAIFTPKALRLLNDASNGTPRIINLLAHKAMLLAAENNERRVDKHHVKLAVQSTEVTEKGSKFNPRDWLGKFAERQP